MISPFSCAIPSPSRNAAHHRTLLGEVIDHQRPRGDRLWQIGHRGKVPRLAIDIQTDDSLGPELLLLRNEHHGLKLVVGRLFVLPERQGSRHSLLERHVFPEAGDSQRGFRH